MDDILCSVVIPVYNEELVITETYRRLKSVMEPLDITYELVFVNDGSSDSTSAILSSICESDRKVRLVDFSRNFGHQMAITAGMDYSCGETVVIIDADLQDPPELIPKLLEKWHEGYDVVYGIRNRREGETVLKKATSMLYYRFLKKIADVDIPLDTGDFRLVDKRVCEALKKVNEKSRYVRGLISWLGFRQTGIEYTRDRRFAGETKYPLKKMLKFACDGIASFSYKPLKLAAWCGYAITAVCIIFLLAMLIIGSTFEGRVVVNNGPSIFSNANSESSISAAVAPTHVSSSASATSDIYPYLALSMLINGIMLISVGIAGAYIGRIYDEVKARPLYIVRSTRNIDDLSEAALDDRRAVRCNERLRQKKTQDMSNKIK